MLHDQVIKVGDRTVTVKGHRREPRRTASKPAADVTAKVVEPPEKKAPRKSTGAATKEV